jgi:hypothetical protein
LLQDAEHRWQRQIFFRVGHRHLALFGGVLELVVRADHVHQISAVGLDLFDDLGAFHMSILHINTHNSHSRSFQTEKQAKVW